MTDWTPLFEDGHDPVPGNPDDVDAMQRWLRTMSSEVQSSIDALAHVDVSAGWRDQAAARFSAGLDTLRKDLPKLRNSFDRAAWGTWRYADDLREAKAKAQKALTMALEARANVQGAQRARLAAAPGQDTSSYDRLESDGNDLLSAAQKLATEAHQGQEQAAQTLIHVLREAGDLGMHNHSFWGDVWGGIAGAAGAVWNSPVAQFLPGLGEVKMATETVAWVGDHLEEISKFCADAGAILGVAALVIAPIPGLDFLDGVLGPAAMALGAFGVVVDGARAAEGRPGASWGMVAMNATVLFGAYGVGRLAMGAAEAWRGREALDAALRLEDAHVNLRSAVRELTDVRGLGGEMEHAELQLRGAVHDLQTSADELTHTTRAKWLYTTVEHEPIRDQLLKTAYAARHPGEAFSYYADVRHLSGAATSVKWQRVDFGQRGFGAALGVGQAWAAHHGG